MSDDRYLDEYNRSLGSPTQRSAEMCGQWQASTGQSCGVQQSWESHSVYTTRVDAYDYAKKNG